VKHSSIVDGVGAIPKVPLTVSRRELIVGGSDSEFRTLVHNLLAFSARLEAVRSSFGTLIGLSGIQYTVLISIAHHQGDEGVGVKAISKHLSLSGAFATIEIGKLVKLDLVEKRVNPTDRRRVLLSVTEKGRDLLAGLAPVQQEVNDLLFEPLDKASFKQLLQLSRDLVTSADKAAAYADYLSGAGAGK
jgi:MarR family transcriptional regulator, organic hydroperoxide resistance regulator